MSKYNEDFRKPASNFKTKKRKCLMCLKQFSSEGPGNRICDECKKTPEYKFGNLNYNKILR